MNVGPQDALGVLYSFIMLICPPSAANHCTDKTKGAIIKREDGLGQYTCEQKIEITGDRITAKWKGRVLVRCEKHEDPTA